MLTEFWAERGLCTSVEYLPDLWQPDTEVPENPHVIVAKRVCFACPVRAQCLDFALRSGQTTGIWGGLTTWERHKLLNPGTTRPKPKRMKRAS